jgi:ankyrin repeat protein
MQLFKSFLIASITALLPCLYLAADEVYFKSEDSTPSNLTIELHDKLIKAIMKRDLKSVKDLIAAGADIEAKTLFGRTALLEAAT